MAEAVEYLVDALYQLRKHRHAVGHAVQGRVGIGDCAVGTLFATVQKGHYRGYRLQRAAQVKQFALLKVGAFEPYARHSRPHVEEVLHGKIVGFGQQSPELAHLRQPLVHLGCV